MWIPVASLISYNDLMALPLFGNSSYKSIHVTFSLTHNLFIKAFTLFVISLYFTICWPFPFLGITVQQVISDLGNSVFISLTAWVNDTLIRFVSPLYFAISFVLRLIIAFSTLKFSTYALAYSVVSEMFSMVAPEIEAFRQSYEI